MKLAARMIAVEILVHQVISEAVKDYRLNEGCGLVSYAERFIQNHVEDILHDAKVPFHDVKAYVRQQVDEETKTVCNVVGLEIR